MAVDSLDSCGVYFGTTGGQVYASADAGDSWAPIVRDLPAVVSVEVQTLPPSLGLVKFRVPEGEWQIVLDLGVVSTSAATVSGERRTHRRTVDDIIEHFIVAVIAAAH